MIEKIKELLAILLDATIDTLKVVVVVFLVYVVLSFFESKIAKKLENSKKFSPLIGSTVGLIPQCGFPVIASDLYNRHVLSTGTLIAIFIACSDEAVPIMLSNKESIKIVVPLLVIKFVVATISGLLIDLILRKKELIDENVSHKDSMLIHKGCCKHEIEDDNETFCKSHLIHPLVHSLKIGAYVLVINLIFSIIIYYIGNDAISNFILSNYYLSPVLASLVGIIPNCASSVILTELFVNGSLSFAATLSGLCCNAGLGLIYLFKDRKDLSKKLLIVLVLLIISIATGYIAMLIQ